MYTYWTTLNYEVEEPYYFSHRLDLSQRVVYRIYLSLIFQRACSCCLHKLEKIRGSPLRALLYISDENCCAVVTRNKELLCTALTRSDIIRFGNARRATVINSTSAKGTHGPTAEKAGMPISHRLFMSKVRRTQKCSATTSILVL